MIKTPNQMNILSLILFGPETKNRNFFFHAVRIISISCFIILSTHVHSSILTILFTIVSLIEYTRTLRKFQLFVFLAVFAFSCWLAAHLSISPIIPRKSIFSDILRASVYFVVFVFDKINDRLVHFVAAYPN